MYQGINSLVRTSRLEKFIRGLWSACTQHQSFTPSFDWLNINSLKAKLLTIDKYLDMYILECEMK